MSCGALKAYLDNAVIFQRLEGESDQLCLPSAKTRKRGVQQKFFPDARPNGARCTRIVEASKIS